MLILFYILISPLIGFFIGAFFVKHDNIYYMNELFSSTSFNASLFLFIFVFVGGLDDGLILKHSITIGPLQISLSFLLDILVSIKLLVVTYISSSLQADFMDNMKYNPRHPKYSSYLALCSFFLLILLTGNNFIEILISWKG
jgi:NADH-quinone oxidoreductase subunit L